MSENGQKNRKDTVSADRVTLREAAVTARVAGETVRRAVRSGALAATRGPRNRYEIDPADLRAWMVARLDADDAVARVVATAPALTPAQRAKLAEVLGGVSTDPIAGRDAQAARQLRADARDGIVGGAA